MSLGSCSASRRATVSRSDSGRVSSHDRIESLDPLHELRFVDSLTLYRTATYWLKLRRSLLFRSAGSIESGTDSLPEELFQFLTLLMFDRVSPWRELSMLCISRLLEHLLVLLSLPTRRSMAHGSCHYPSGCTRLLPGRWIRLPQQVIESCFWPEIASNSESAHDQRMITIDLIRNVPRSSMRFHIRSTLSCRCVAPYLCTRRLGPTIRSAICARRRLTSVGGDGGNFLTQGPEVVQRVCMST